MSNYTELIERLRTAAWAGPVPCPVCDEAADALEAAQAREIAELRKDAERYRLLRACGVDSYEACGSGEKLDAECDAAIAAKGMHHG